MRRCLRVGLVGVLAILMTIDTAVACRWFGGRRIRRSCECMPCPPMPSCGHDVLMPDQGTMPDRPPVPPEKAPLERPRIDAEPPTKADVKEPVEEPIKEPPVKEPPVKEPPAKKDALEDLFDTPPKEDTKKPEPPADTKKEEPAAKEEMPKEKEKVEDLFDTPKVKAAEKAKETPAAETPAKEEPAKEEPADAKAKVDDLEKLFESDKKKAEEPKTEEPPPAGEKKADSTEASPAKDAVDDLFEDPPKKASDVAVADAPATVQPVALASIKNPLAIEAQERNWRDDTGQYGCRGRLVLVTEGKVRILKDNGRYTTVPFDRLSEADLEYVRQEATRASAPAVNATAQK